MKQNRQIRKQQRLIPVVTVWFALLGLGTVRAEDGNVSFKRDVAPIFLENCVACHDARKAEGGYRIDTFAELSKPGDSGVLPLTVSKDENAELLRRLTTNDQFERMPAESEALNEDQIKVVAAWIEQGAKFDGDDPDKRLPFVIPPREYPPAPASYSSPMQVTAVAFSTEHDLIFSGGYHEILAWDSEGNLQTRIGNVGQQTFAIAFPPVAPNDESTTQRSGNNQASPAQASPDQASPDQASPDQASPGQSDASKPADTVVGRQLVVASGRPGFGGDVRLIDLTSHQVTAVLARCDDVILDLAFRPDGKRLAIASADKTIRIVDMETQQVQQTLLSHADFVTALAWSNDGTKLVSASRDKTAKVFNAETGQLLISYQGHGDAVRGVFVLPDGKQIVSTGNDKKLHRWNISDAKKTAEVAIGGEGYRIAAAENCVLVPSSDKRLVKIDLGKNQVATEFKGHADWVLCSAVDAGQSKVVTGSHDGEIRVWNLADGTLLSRWLAQPPSVAQATVGGAEASESKTGEGKPGTGEG